MQRSSYALSSRLIVTSVKRGGHSATLVWTSFRNMCASAGKRLRKRIEVLQCVELIGDFWYSSRIPGMPAGVRTTLCARCYGPCSVTCAVCSVSFFHVLGAARARGSGNRAACRLRGRRPGPGRARARRGRYTIQRFCCALPSVPGRATRGPVCQPCVTSPPIHRIERKAPYADCLRSFVAPAQR